MASETRIASETRMPAELRVSRDSVVVLAKTGRQASWHRLTDDERRSAEREHVDLMLSIAARHRMRRLEGFRLIGPQGRWERFWLIEFPDLDGAETWIEAEMAPPYGRYGFYEYHLTRPLAPELFDTWLPGPPRVIAPQNADPAAIPALGIDRSSVVVLQFSRSDGADGRADAEQTDDLQRVAREHGMLRLECFQLIDPVPAWHRAWICEFPDLAGAEAWIEAEAAPARAARTERISCLSRRWSPAYFASWCRADG